MTDLSPQLFQDDKSRQTGTETRPPMTDLPPQLFQDKKSPPID